MGGDLICHEAPIEDNPLVQEGIAIEDLSSEDEGLLVAEGATIILEENIEAGLTEGQPSTSLQGGSPILQREGKELEKEESGEEFVVRPQEVHIPPVAKRRWTNTRTPTFVSKVYVRRTRRRTQKTQPVSKPAEVIAVDTSEGENAIDKEMQENPTEDEIQENPAVEEIQEAIQEEIVIDKLANLVSVALQSEEIIGDVAQQPEENMGNMPIQNEEVIEEIPWSKVGPIKTPSSLTSLSIALTFFRPWEIEKDRLQGIINKQQKEIEKKDNRIKELETKVEEIYSMVPEIMQCRAPPRIYAVHLKERYLNFILNHIVRDLITSLETPKEFYHASQTSPHSVKNLLCELYLHNYAMPQDREWNPLL